MNRLRKLGCYGWHRLTERSSIAAMGSAVLQAAFVPAPWSLVFVGIAVFQVLVPDGRLASNPDSKDGN